MYIIYICSYVMARDCMYYFELSLPMLMRCTDFFKFVWNNIGVYNSASFYCRKLWKQCKLLVLTLVQLSLQ